MFCSLIAHIFFTDRLHIAYPYWVEKLSQTQQTTKNTTKSLLEV